ncbi:MAG: type II toxin-antitoxin system HicA family toxin [candidate division Zixibacteria bacterium]|jgi:predicted RNA binding protein YcfA (HicA-like mRNA interferase family)|nr:type II toxin-antitoxin system HicA family toxin [candidate division Zixibacteria bacterium]
MPDKRLLSLSSKDVKKILKENNFILSRQKGSHQQFVGNVKGKKRRVTVIVNQKHFAPRTLKSMISQSGLSEGEWLESI